MKAFSRKLLFEKAVTVILILYFLNEYGLPFSRLLLSPFRNFPTVTKNFNGLNIDGYGVSVSFPTLVQEMILIYSTEVSLDYSLPKMVVESPGLFYRAIYGLWPKQYQPDSSHLFSLKGNNIPEHCSLYKAGQEVNLVNCTP